MAEIEQGALIDGFRLGEKIHLGSMASIFRLAGAGSPLPLIMKIPRLGPGERSLNVTGFEVCRTVLGALPQSSHYPTLVAYGDIETTPYLVMEFVDGARLNDWLDRIPLAPQEVARIGSAIALALREIHQHDVVHLDLKPTNVLFRPDGQAVLIDFGLAHHGHFPDLFAEDFKIPIGNWVYMAPEQIVGVRCDPRSDIFALGGMLYELATGRLPFGRPSTVAELRQRLYRDPVPPRRIVPSIPESLQEIILRCLEVDARGRYASADDLAVALSIPERVAITDRGLRRRSASFWATAKQRIRVRRFEPAPCPPPSSQPRTAPVVVVALAPEEGNERLREALRGAARGAIAACAGCRIACITVVPPAVTLSGEGDENSATTRHIRRLVDLRHWARPLDLPEDRVTYHVLESEKPAATLVDYVTNNDVEQILIGAPGGTPPLRRSAGLCAQLVSAAPCTVTVVRPRPEV